MIDANERDKSKSELIAFFESVPSRDRQSLGLMGGWAVNSLLENRGISHIGSRDIDIFFDPQQIKYESVVTLIKNRRFIEHSTFRWIKYFSVESQEELSEQEATKLSQFNLVNIFLDLAAPANLEHVLYEPLLGQVFSGKNEYWKISNLAILMPDPEIMVMTKIKSTTERTESFKREKDLADLLMLLRNVNSLWKMGNGARISLRDDLRESSLDVLKASITKYQVDGTLSNACNAIGLSIEAALAILQVL
jgi:hypothetical protein